MTRTPPPVDEPVESTASCSTPWHLLITEDNRFVRVGDQDAGDIAVFERAPDLFRLDSLDEHPVPRPSSVALLRP
jgi:6-phosphogluconolactonase (cycloisomerase 2 family)